MRELGFTTDRVMRTTEVLVAAEHKKSGRR
jgi:hypothetical protein